MLSGAHSVLDGGGPTPTKLFAHGNPPVHGHDTSISSEFGSPLASTSFCDSMSSVDQVKQLEFLLFFYIKLLSSILVSVLTVLCLVFLYILQGFSSSQGGYEMPPPLWMSMMTTLTKEISSLKVITNIKNYTHVRFLYDTTFEQVVFIFAIDRISLQNRRMHQPPSHR